MRLIYIFISYVSSHPTCLEPLLAQHQGCPELLLCYSLALAVVVDCPCVRGGTARPPPRTHGQPTSTEPNGSIATAQDTPDNGPVKARNM
jgi:hypothetical protein